MRLPTADVHVDAAHLQRMETGRIRRPNVDTIDALLTYGLEVPYRIGRNVLDAFGHRLPWTLPTDSQIDEARRLFSQELGVATWPVCQMDPSPQDPGVEPTRLPPYGAHAMRVVATWAEQLGEA